MLGQFYLATSALETRVDELLSGATSDDAELLVAKISELGYSFSKGYALDLQALLGSDWEGTVRSWATEPTKEYVRRLGRANDDECAAAAFILHGPLIIGGGAALKPRVEKSFGPDATNVFEQVIGMARGGRSARRKEFIELYDTLLLDTDTNERFQKIVEASGQFMDLNNQMMLAVRQRPWWTKYVAAAAVAVVSAVGWRFVVGQSPVSPPKTE